MASCSICIRPRHLPVTPLNIVTLSEEGICNVTPHPQEPFQKTGSQTFNVQPMERSPRWPFSIRTTRPDTWQEKLIPGTRNAG